MLEVAVPVRVAHRLWLPAHDDAPRQGRRVDHAVEARGAQRREAPVLPVDARRLLQIPKLAAGPRPIRRHVVGRAGFRQEHEIGVPIVGRLRSPVRREHVADLGRQDDDAAHAARLATPVVDYAAGQHVERQVRAVRVGEAGHGAERDPAPPHRRRVLPELRDLVPLERLVGADAPRPPLGLAGPLPVVAVDDAVDEPVGDRPPEHLRDASDRAVDRLGRFPVQVRLVEPREVVGADRRQQPVAADVLAEAVALRLGVRGRPLGDLAAGDAAILCGEERAGRVPERDAGAGRDEHRPPAVELLALRGEQLGDLPGRPRLAADDDRAAAVAPRPAVAVEAESFGPLLFGRGPGQGRSRHGGIVVILVGSSQEPIFTGDFGVDKPPVLGFICSVTSRAFPPRNRRKSPRKAGQMSSEFPTHENPNGTRSKPGVDCGVIVGDAACGEKPPARVQRTYFIHCPATNRVKIGRALDVAARFRRIQCSASSRLTLLGSIEGDREAELHRLHRADRAIGEWFDLTAAVRRTLASLLGESPKLLDLRARRRAIADRPVRTGLKGGANPAAKLSDKQVAAMLVHPEIKRSAFLAGRAFGVSEQTASLILRRKARASVDPAAFDRAELEAIGQAAEDAYYAGIAARRWAGCAVPVESEARDAR